MNKTILEFVRKRSFSITYSNLTEEQLANGPHGSGHVNDGVNGASGAAIMCCIFIIIFITFYMGNRIYRQRKYFTFYWTKEFGESNYNPNEEDPQVS